MKKFRPLFLLLVTFGVMSASPAFSQVRCNLLQANNAVATTHVYSIPFIKPVRERKSV
ncbi:MAG TPA: hypothetical protein VNS58_23490 [Puia sp.]|nr:hypothetical protein [Puia sp.]